MSQLTGKYVLFVVTLLILALAACVPVQTKEASFSEASNEATSATISIAMPFETATISALDANADNLIEAEIEYIGDMTFDVSGTDTRTVRLSEDLPNRPNTGRRTLNWDIHLSPDVPLDLSLAVSSGKMEADLRELQITDFAVNVSSGNVEVNLPASETSIDASIDVSSGTLVVDIPEGSALDFGQISLSSGDVTLNVGEDVTFTANVHVASGDLVFDVPAGAAVQVNANRVSSGNVRVPADYERVRTGNNNDEGVWESPGWEDADTQIVIDISMSSGSVKVQ